VDTRWNEVLLKDLEANTEYSNFRIKAVNEMGEGEDTLMITAKTLKNGTLAFNLCISK